jgi:hypothetical protein
VAGDIGDHEGDPIVVQLEHVVPVAAHRLVAGCRPMVRADGVAAPAGQMCGQRCPLQQVDGHPMLMGEHRCILRLALGEHGRRHVA